MKRLVWVFLVLAGNMASAAPVMPGVTAGKGNTLSMPMQVIVLLTALAVLPAVIMSVTPFLRITVVLHFLRQALGTQTVPSN
jgi:flagellar biosynthetic protein FliP